MPQGFSPRGFAESFTPRAPRFLELLIERFRGQQQPDQEVPSREPKWRRGQDPMPQWSPREPGELKQAALDFFKQALQADPTGASGMANPVAGPAMLGALFKNPALARLFSNAAQTQLGGTAGTPMRAEEMLRNKEFFVRLMRKMGMFPEAQRGHLGAESTFGANFMNALGGETFGKNILPWSGAAHRNPMAMDEQALFAALLSQFTP